MGAGASSAAPTDIALLNQCLDCLSARDLESTTAQVEKDVLLQAPFLAEVPEERMASLLPILEAAIEKYLMERRQAQAHAEACESALAAARAVFSAGKPLRPFAATSPQKHQAAVPVEDTAAGPMLRDSSSKQSKSPSEAQGRRRRGRDAPAKPAAKILLSALRSCYEAAEIGGGTLYTTSLDLYEDGSCEFGSHDVGQQGRQVTRSARRGQSFSEALFWGGYEYFKGTWALADPPETSPGGDAPRGRRFRVTLTGMRTQPSDPYCSERSVREVTGSFVVQEAEVDMPLVGASGVSAEGGEAAAPVESDSSGSTVKVQGLILSDFEGEPHTGAVKFKELRVASVVVEGKEMNLLPAGVADKTKTIEGCEGVLGDDSVQADYRMEKERQKGEAAPVELSPVGAG
mmetsp:Transcript_52754/g.104686  ORF Transcript_52754/g.104686 Transcript_52754/m.104686 type:complete len:403 (+) Transcript_52754:113-1321(+)